MLFCIKNGECVKQGKFMNQVEIFKTEGSDIELTVSLDNDTVWLNRQQLSILFERDIKTIGKHIAHVFKDGELEKDAVVAKFATTAEDGKTYQTEHYNLDVIISVGYRIKSQRGVQFRKWATKVLKQYLVQGYALNERRMQEKSIEVEQVLSLLSSTLNNQDLVTNEGQSVLSVISDYARSWTLLQGYDEQSFDSNKLAQPNMVQITFEDAVSAIESLKKELIEKGEATSLFGQLRGNGLDSALSTIEQGFGDELFYPNIASRAAHLLYFVIKNHPLADGNKRSGSFLFLWYLRLNQAFLAKPVEQLINDNTLVALALLISESKPEQKELMIRLIEHFLPLK